ncbi:hypothetical protein AYY19_02875 [Photobacterium aquimaris]|uniref:DUF2057 domain-containing protein n=1 Tax=Photobacterium aquimaris TaxID=512643 RepID=A0A2T3IJ64_9GAMM|nr:DUF2057 family protein [Photobacterium aquimaris]OBU14727.1 hypothetical protein AYY20_07595 [Photobacterium aquimaris]OBU18821.1 hypothetical protein AYY19_02875 [Photobacterium aquimaris]PSU28363.1 DUF2057 domain-containing protein [Photobacterium aquimaris]PSW02828.1 DUF2057 domain-containing protein [Photobacterium aquimaris]
MKLGKKLLLASALVMAHGAQAAVDVSFAPDVETVIVNGNKTLNLLEKTEDLTLNNGLNQIVVRVSKLVEGQGQLEKYRSEPIVITLTVNDKQFKVVPGARVVSSIDVRNFDANPTVKLIASNGDVINAKMDVLPRNNSGDTATLFGRDYLKDLAYYNQSQGYAFAGEKPLVEPKKKPKQLVKIESPATAVEPVAIVQPAKMVAAEQELKNIYSQLTPQQRKAFLGWAVTQ